MEIPRGDYIIKVNNRKVLDGVLTAAGILDPNDSEVRAEQRGIVMRAMDKLDRIGADGVKELLGRGRRDESGDFTEGARLSDNQIELICSFLQCGSADPGASLKALQLMVGGTEIGLQGVRELEEISDLLAAQGMGSSQFRIDPSVVRGLSYYTGPVLEAETSFGNRNGQDRPKNFGSIAGGGRYDGLVRRFTGQDVPATGISIGVDRLLATLDEVQRGGRPESIGPVLITVMDRDRMADYQTMALELRTAGIRAEVFLGNARNFGRQLKYADQRGSPIAVIEGDDELTPGCDPVERSQAGGEDRGDSNPRRVEIAPVPVRSSSSELGFRSFPNA